MKKILFLTSLFVTLNSYAEEKFLNCEGLNLINDGSNQGLGRSEAISLKTQIKKSNETENHPYVASIEAITPDGKHQVQVYTQELSSGYGISLRLKDIKSNNITTTEESTKPELIVLEEAKENMVPVPRGAANLTLQIACEVIAE